MPTTLFSPYELAGLELKNRVVMPAMGTGLAGADGHVNDATIAYYERRAEGGVGMIVLEASLVAPGNSAIGPELHLDDPSCIAGLRDLSSAVHRHGVPVGAQLWHPGRQTLLSEPVAPSPIPLSARSPIPRELSLEDIAQLVGFFGSAAAHCREGGCDFVEIHAAHCYLPCEFLSPLCNFRTDEYGGSLQNRARFLLEIVHSIRAACGDDFPIFCRVSGEEGTDGGFTLEESTQVCLWLEQAGVECLSVSAGSWHALHLTIPPMSMKRGCLVPLAAHIKSQVGIPVIAAGRLDLPEDCEAVLDAGQADLVAVGRALIADPDWAWKAMRGLQRDIRPCISCNACLDLVSRGEQARCAVNPEVSRETTWRLEPTATPRRIMVVGSGPAGMEAARVARLRGHSVSIWEREGELGGKLDVASRAPSKFEVLRFRDYQARKLDELGVEIHLGVEVDAAMVEREDPDVVLVAVGAEPLIPPIPGIHGPNVIDAQDLLLGRIELQADERVAIVGGSATGVETAEALLGAVAEIFVLDMRKSFGVGVELITRQRLLAELRHGGVKFLAEAKVMMIEPPGVIFEDRNGETQVVEVDRVALAIGWRPRGSELGPLIKGREVIVLGDASRPADFVAAVSDGAVAALAV